MSSHPYAKKDSGAGKELNILDLTNPDTLFELAIEIEEIVGLRGDKLLRDLFERAGDAEYTHLIYRDPLRPGRIWLRKLGPEGQIDNSPTRARLDESRRITEKVFPGLLDILEDQIEASDETGSKLSGSAFLVELPPIIYSENSSVSGIDVATALEYLIFLYPELVRPWAALIFTYSEIIGLPEAAERVRAECTSSCEHAQVVAHLLGPDTIPI